MKVLTHTSDYSKLVAQKLNLPFKVVHKIMITFNKRVVRTMKQGDDIVIENCISIHTNKKATVNYYKTMKK